MAHMSISAMKQALEALESIKVTVSTSIEANVIDGVDLFPKEIAALCQAIAEAECDAEVYSVWVEQRRTHTPEDVKKIESKWVGLTDHELQVLDFNDPDRGKLARAVEAKLKEKNG